MEQSEITRWIGRARGGDVCAFTELVRRFQDRAFGYAFALLRDFQLAEDATQEAFVAVYASLSALREPDAFPGWLRGIVRYQCHRIQRKRGQTTTPLDLAWDLPAPDAEPQRLLEAEETRDAVLAAVNALPLILREVITLYYFRDHSQQEIAAFLELPVSTINSRLHAARTRLKRRMLPMLKDTLKQNALPGGFAEKVGKIVQVQGALIEAKFAPEDLPALFGALTFTDPKSQQNMTASVVQRLGDDTVRGIAPTSLPALNSGINIVSRNTLAGQAMPPDALKAALSTLHPAPTANPQLLETGIKVIDLFSPFAQGGSVGLFAEWGLGVLVLIPELLHNLARHSGSVTLFTFEPPKTEAEDWKNTVEEIGKSVEPFARSGVQTLYLPVAAPNDPELESELDFLDTAIHLASDIAKKRFYPAVDPLRSHSRLLDPAIVGQEHVEIATQARDLLQRYRDAWEPTITQSGRAALSEEERVLAGRARKIQRFCTQPFHVAEPYTKMHGQFVTREETLRGFQAILSGECDYIPEEAFVYCGQLGEAWVRGNAMR